jgi:hypothetical protein
MPARTWQPTRATSRGSTRPPRAVAAHAPLYTRARVHTCRTSGRTLPCNMSGRTPAPPNTGPATRPAEQPAVLHVRPNSAHAQPKFVARADVVVQGTPGYPRTPGHEPTGVRKPSLAYAREGFTRARGRSLKTRKLQKNSEQTMLFGSLYLGTHTGSAQGRYRCASVQDTPPVVRSPGPSQGAGDAWRRSSGRRAA